MIFYYLNSERARKLIFHVCNLCNLLSIAMAGLGGIKKEFIALAIMATSNCFFNLNKNYNCKACSLLHSAFFSFSVILPCAYIINNIDVYQFGCEIGFQIPFKNEIYTRNLSKTILWITLLNFTSSLVLLKGKSGRKSFYNNGIIESNKRTPVFIMAFCVLFVGYFKSTNTLHAFADPFDTGGSIFSYLSLLVSDTVYLVIFSLWVFMYPLKQKVQIPFFLVLAAFSLFDVLFCGSKGSIIKLFNLCYLIPIAFMSRIKTRHVLIPRWTTVVAALCLALWLFSFSKVYRNELFDYDSTVIEKITNTLGQEDFGGFPDRETFAEMAKKAMIRQSADFDRICIITTSFLLENTESQRSQLIFYTLKNSANQLLPGTPFPEAYNPSSNIFEQIVYLDNLEKGGSINDMTGTNTQPLTLIGIMTIFAGSFAFIPLALTTYLISAFTETTLNPALGLIALIFYNILLHCYGLEIVFKEGLIYLVSCFFFIAVFRSVDKSKKWT